MATRVRRTWDVLEERVQTQVPALSSVAAFRRWLLEDLLQVSRKLPPRLDEVSAHPAWQRILTAPVEDLAVTHRAWDELATALQPSPPTHDPVRLLAWATDTLWSLSVFTLQDDVCDDDQFGLEVWAPQTEGAPVLLCGLGGCFAYRHRDPLDSRPLEPWIGEPETLLPASRAQIERLIPDPDLLQTECDRSSPL